ncbi:MAG: metallophosphoesterase family protein, partial [Paludibacteraceae bacterium]|nr:metallophosphoesterase family protein [Paludibacteraceae bacterium]
YNPNVRQEFLKSTPRLFVCGHSHILKVMADKKFGMLCVNPGAAGRYGQQTVRTLVRLVIDGDTMRDLEVIELTW